MKNHHQQCEEDIIQDLLEDAEESLTLATTARQEVIANLRIAEIRNKMCYLMYPDAEALAELNRELVKLLVNDNYLGNHAKYLIQYDIGLSSK